MMPITSIARESRGVETKHRANLSGAQGGNQTIKAGSLDGATCGATEIVVDHFDIGEAASTCDFNQLVLAPLALQVQLNLLWRRLADIDDRLALENHCWKESVMRCHRRPPALPPRPEPRHRSQHGLALRRCHCPKSHVVENEIELAWCPQGCACK